MILKRTNTIRNEIAETVLKMVKYLFKVQKIGQYTVTK